MIRSISGVAKKILAANKMVFLSTILSIAISVALIVSMFSMAQNAENTIKDGFTKLYGTVDIFASYDQSQPFLSEVIDEIKELSTIHEIAGFIVGHLAIEQEGNGTYSVGIDNSELAKTRYKYAKDIKKGEIALNQGLLKAMNKKIGDKVMVEQREFVISEVIDDVSQSTDMPDVALIHIESYRDLLKEPVPATHVLVDVADKQSVLQVAEEIKRIDPNIQLDLLEENEEIQANMSSLKAFMIVLSIIIVLMCSLFVLSNFQIFLYNYRKQFALFRAIGAGAKQSFTLVFYQCTVMNVIGVSLGLLLSYFSNTFFQERIGQIFFDASSSMPFSLSFSATVGISAFLIIEIFMLLPAIRSSKIMPLSIVEENEKLDGSSKTKYIGYGAMILSCILFVMGYIKTYQGGTGVSFGIFSSALFILSVYMVFPFTIQNILKRFIPAARVFGRKNAVVAIKNLLPQVSKSTVIMMAISTMIVITLFGGSFYHTILKSNEEYLKKEYALDLVVTTRETSTLNLDEEFRAALSRLDSIESSVAFSNMNYLYYKSGEEQKDVDFVYIDIESMVKEGMLPQGAMELRGDVIINQTFADLYNLSVNDIIEVKGSEDSTDPTDQVDTQKGFQQKRIGMIVDELPYPGNYTGEMVWLDWADSAFQNEFTGLNKSYISTNDLEQTVNELEQLKRTYPQIKWSTLEEALSYSDEMMAQRWQLFIIVILSILGSLIFGGVNMLMNNILSKRKEYAILRTFQVEKKDLIVIILTQVLVYNFIGILLGTAVGTVMTHIIMLTENNRFANIDFSLMGWITLIIICVSILVFVPVGISLSKKKIAKEIR